MRLTSSRRGPAALILSLALLACDGWPPDPPPPPVVVLGLSLDSTDVTIHQGAERALTASVKRVGEVGVKLQLRAEGVSAGITVEIGTMTTAGDLTTAPVTVRVAESVPVGQYSFTLRALGEPLKRATVSPSLAVVIVRVTEPSTFQVELARGSVSMMRGGTARVTARLPRTNLDEPITLSVIDAAGVSASFSENPTSGDSVVVTLTADAQSTPGSRNARVRGSAPGIPEREAPLVVVVTDDPIQLLPPEALVVGQGATAAVEVQLLRAGYDGALTLAVEQAPAGVTGEFEPTSTSGQQAILLLTAQATVEPGSYPVIVSAVGSGVAKVTADLLLVVQPSSVSVSVDPGSLSLIQGTSVTTHVKVNRTHFDGPVTLAADDLPPGLMVTSTPAVITGSTAQITVSAPEGQPPGNFLMVIRPVPVSSGPGTSTATVLAVHVSTPVTAGNVTLDWSECTAPDWLAYQDGDGPWIQLHPVGGIARFPVTSDRGGYAYVEGASSLSVRLFTRDELTEVPFAKCAPPLPPTRTVHGTGIHGPQSSGYRYFIGGRMGTSSSQQPNFSIAGVPTGPQDLLAIGNIVGQTRVLIRRSLDPSDAAPVEAVDMADLQASAVFVRTITVNGPGAPTGNGTLRMTTDYLLPPACYRTAEPLLSGLQGIAGTASWVRFINMFGVPPAQQSSGDFHLINAEFVAGTSQHVAGQVFHAMQARTINIIATPDPTVTNVGSTHKRLMANWGALPASYNRAILLEYSDQQRRVEVRASRGYVGDAGVTIATPDLRGVSGWQPSYGIPAAEQGTWLLQADGSNGQGLCHEGRTLQTARHRGSF